jgi:DNA polymerase III delta subunit
MLSNLKPVYALAGADLFLQLDQLGELLRDAPKDIQRVDLDGESAQLADVLDELRSFAMFTSAKLVSVRNADPFLTRYRAALEQYVSKPAAGSTLILRLASLAANQRIYKLIAQNGQVVDCNPPKEKDLPAWVIQRAKSAHALTIKPDAARLLVDHLGDDLGKIDNELAKLALQVDGPADIEIVRKSVAFQREQEMWHMTNELAAGNVAAAVRRWRQLVQSDSSSEFRAVTWLTMWLEKVRKALAMKKQGQADFNIARELKIWPQDQQRPFFQTAVAIGEAGCARLISRLADVDHRSKSGLGDMAENVEQFLLSTALHTSAR